MTMASKFPYWQKEHLAGVHWVVEYAGRKLSDQHIVFYGTPKECDEFIERKQRQEALPKPKALKKKTTKKKGKKTKKTT